MREVTIKIDDEIYEFYSGVADAQDTMSVEDVIAAAVQEFYEWDV